MKQTKNLILKIIFMFIMGFSLQAVENAKNNPYLSAPVYGITHFDSTQSDTYPYPVLKGTFSLNLDNYPQVTGGPVNIMTFASTSPDYMWGVSNQGVTYIDVKNKNFKEVARYNFPGVRVLTKQIHAEVLRKNYKTVDELSEQIKKVYQFDFNRLYAGNYAVVDNNNVVYVNQGTSVYTYALKNPNNPSEGIVQKAYLDGTKFLDKGERISGLSMTYDGMLIIVGNRSLSAVNRNLDMSSLKVLHFEEDDYVSNGVSIDEKNGIYVVSEKLMRKIVWTGSNLSTSEKDGAWSTKYDTGDAPAVTKVGKGSGSTPTLMGFGPNDDKLVVITDGADRMNIVAFWRDEIPANFKKKSYAKSNRIADQMPITAGLPKNQKWIQSEQSVVVKDYGAFVVNNIMTKDAPKTNDLLALTLAIGPIIDPPTGVEKVEWDPKTDKWKSMWTRKDVVSISMIPAMSTTSNIVLVNGYYKNSGWEITGLDWNTGKTVHQSKFGFDNFGNGQYATIQFLADGDLLFNSVAGPIRIDYKK